MVSGRIGGISFGFALTETRAEITSLSVQADMALELAQSHQQAGADFTALALAPNGILLAADQHSNELLSYRVTDSGALTLADRAGGSDSAGFSAPSRLETVTLAGQNYAILAAAGSNTLTVFLVQTDGSLTATDHLMDSTTTRFADVTQLTSASYGDWQLLLAAGSDDGLSLLALLPGGQLLHLDSLADGLSVTLDNPSALAAGVLGSQLQVFASSQSETGISQIQADLSHLGVIRQGSGADLILEGSPLDDVLIAGAGGDQLRGGAGQDIFVFRPGSARDDGYLGRVLDFTPTQDRLDLSTLPFLYSLGQVEIESRASGALLRFGDFWLEVDGAAGPLNETDFTTAAVLNAQHLKIGMTSPDTSPGAAQTGTTGNDQLIGTSGNDTLTGGAGDDTLTGGSGTDTAIFNVASGDVTVRVSDGALWLSSAEGTDLVSGVEHFQFSDTSLTLTEVQSLADRSLPLDLTGTDRDDRLQGGSHNDTLSGLGGADTLLGEAGNDSLRGGDGTDTLNGGPGDDVIFGGSSAADLRDVIYGGAGADSIDGGHGNDLIYGMDGNDTIAGGFGADALQGQNGNDVITGSALSDEVFGGAGDDFVNGGFGHDRINGGSGADKFFHLGIADHGSDWVQDYNAAENDVLLFGNSAVSADDFQVNFVNTAGAGDAAVQEAFVIYRPAGQILWALVDGAGQDEINLKIGGDTFDLLA